MKNILIFIALSFLFPLQAQQISYTYDAAGNRISRTIVMPPQQARVRNLPVDTVDYTLADINTDADMFENTFGFYADQLDEASITIYPNPTQGLLKVDIDNLPDNNTSIQVYNLSGKLLMQQNNISNTTDIDISNQSPGTYILKINLSSKTTTWKIIKQ